jgi:hypothetical protein
MCIHAAVGLCSAGCLLSLWSPVAGAVLAVVGLAAGVAALARYARPLPALPAYDAEAAFRRARAAADAQRLAEARPAVLESTVRVGVPRRRRQSAA